MKSQLQLAGALLRKDFLLFWHFALLNAALILLWQFPTVVGQIGGLAQLGQVALLLANVMLILAVFHEDAMVSLKHDWLTRPVPGLVLLGAKCVFVILAFIVPALVGVIANGIYQGHSVAESVARGFATAAGGSVITFNLLVMVFAAVTASARQALVVFLAGLVSLFFMAWITNRILGLGGAGFLGSGWVIGRTVQIALVLVAVAVLWVQYGPRHTRAPRVIVGIAVVAGWTFILLMSGPRMFALQKVLSSDPAAGAPIEIASGEGCFPARARNETPAEAAAAAVESGSMIVMPPGRTGESVIAFSTQSIPLGVPPGDRLDASRVRLTYRIAGQTPDPRHPLQALRLQTPNDGGLLEPSQNWLLSRSTYNRLAHSARIETQISYSLSLLAPKATAEFLADGRRQYYPGLGYCGATVNGSEGLITVECFKLGSQPAQFVATLVGGAGSASAASGYPDFTPAVLDFWGGQPHIMRLSAPGNSDPRVKVTAYAGVAHFDREVVLPGLLGGSLSSCPAP